MALRYARLEGLLISRTFALSLACKRHTSFNALLHPSLSVDSEPSTQTGTQPRNAPKPPMQRPKVEEYLQYVAENSVVTLADLESFRPPSHALVGSVEYESQYQALLEKLDRSFTVSQLRQFLRLYGTPVSTKMRKQTAATTIIEKQWGWPSLAKSQKLARAQKERSSRVFPLNPQQAFLLLGKDGTEILALSQTYNVRLQFSRKPLSLSISGTTASVEQLEKYVETLREEIVWQDFDPPRQFDMSSSSQELSRSSGCFLELSPDEKIRIWYRESSADLPSRAKRLIVQHSIEDVDVPLAACPFRTDSGPISCDSAPSTYALYPFLFESTRSPGNKCFFRLRRVGKWFGIESNTLSHVNNDDMHDYVATVGEYASPREQLVAQLGELGGDYCVSIVASPGHVVFNSQGPSPLSLAPPLEGQKNFADVMSWVHEATPRTEFIHSAPVRLWQAPDPNQRWRRRLVYETIPNCMERTHMLVCEYTPVNMGTASLEVDADPPHADISEPAIRCGSVTRLDVLMPDDARDLRLTLNAVYTLPEPSWPAELSDLINDRTSSLNSDAHLTFEYENKKFILKEDTLVQSNSLPIKPEKCSVSVTSERRFDPQSPESYQSYEVYCSDLNSDEAWGAFWDKCKKIVQDSSTPSEEIHYQDL